MGIRRWIVVFTIGVIVLLAIFYGFLPKPVPVDSVKVKRGPMRVTIEEEGETRVKERFIISAPVAGFMRRVELEVGNPVKRGQIIAELEPLRSDALDPRSRAEAEASVSAAESSLRAAEEQARAAAADAEYARRKLERVAKLFLAGVISKDQFDQADAEAKRLEANLLSSEAAVKVARSELERARSKLHYSGAEAVPNPDRIIAIRTPVKGRVLKIHRKSEGVMNSGEAIIDVGDPINIEVKIEVLSADAVSIKAGTPVLFERWGGDSGLSGRVRVVEPAGFTKVSSLGVEEQRVLVIADILSSTESRDRLGDGYRVEARFIIWEGEGVLQIPSSALFRKGKNWAVFVVKNNRAHQREVEIGHRTGLTAEVVSGLIEGEDVIAYPDDSIQEGTRVRPRQ
jgi:HlyD family secretion protein